MARKKKLQQYHGVNHGEFTRFQTFWSDNCQTKFFVLSTG